MRVRAASVNSPIWALLMFSLLAGTCTSLAQCRFKKTDLVDAVTYRFSLEDSPKGMQLKVEMSFHVNAGVPVEVDIPSELISDLQMKGTQGTLKVGPSGTKTIVTSTSGPVLLSYILPNGWTGPMVHPHEFQPVVRPQYFEITGDKALVWLKKDHDRRVTANFDWQRLPRTWTLATSFGTAGPLPTEVSQQKEPLPKQRCQTYEGPWIAVNRALFAAGDFRLHPFRIGRRSGVLAVRGTWTFSDEEAANEIGRTVKLVRDFWHDDAFPYFLVTLQPFDQDHGSSDGTAYTNAFWMYISRKDSINGLLLQLAHESFHAWNPLKMGYLSAPEYEKTKWFEEGFTEYYARKLTFESGELSDSKLVNLINKDLLAFHSSINEYIRGPVIALWLDAAIRQESHNKYSLDDVMFRMVHDRKQPLTEQRIFATVARYVSSETLLILKRAADQQGNLPIPETIPGVRNCYHAVHGDFPTFNLGLDSKKTRVTKAISEVDPSGPAFLAGLRDGQNLVAYSFDPDDPNQQATFTISVDGAERRVSFNPLGHPVSTWQYTFSPGPSCKVKK